MPYLVLKVDIISPSKNALSAISFHKVSVMAGTIFHRTHKPLILWFRAIWWLMGQKNGASAVTIQKIMGLGGYKTAWAWLQKLKKSNDNTGKR